VRLYKRPTRVRRKSHGETRTPAWGAGSIVIGMRLLIFLSLVVVAGFAPDANARADAGADGHFERRESFHFTLYQDVDIDEYGGFNGSRRFEQEILKQLENAFDRLDRILDLRPERKLDVHIWDPAIFDQRFAGLFRFPAAGFYGGSVHVRGATVVTPGLIRVLHHELVHAAFDAAAPRLVLPSWMNEGIAEWFEARAMGKRSLSGAERSLLAAAARRGELFSLQELSVQSLAGFSPNAAALAYLESYGFIAHLADSYGEKKLVQFWSELLRSRSLERASRRAFSRDLDDLEADYFKTLGTR
jgi:hypothetical protein